MVSSFLLGCLLASLARNIQLYIQRENLAQQLSLAELGLEIRGDEIRKFARAFASHPSQGSGRTCCYGASDHASRCSVHVMRLEK